MWSRKILPLHWPEIILESWVLTTRTLIHPQSDSCLSSSECSGTLDLEWHGLLYCAASKIHAGFWPHSMLPERTVSAQGWHLSPRLFMMGLDSSLLSWGGKSLRISSPQKTQQTCSSSHYNSAARFLLNVIMDPNLPSPGFLGVFHYNYIFNVNHCFYVFFTAFPKNVLQNMFKC